MENESKTQRVIKNPLGLILRVALIEKVDKTIPAGWTPVGGVDSLSANLIRIKP